MEEHQKPLEKVYSERVKAGRRTYFFDIKPTKTQDFFLTITELKRNFHDEGGSEKHKIFLYKEDLNKFVSALQRAADHIKEELLPDYDFTQFDRKPEELEGPQ